VRGTARSQVLKGLSAGEEVLLSAGGDAETVLNQGEEPGEKPGAESQEAAQGEGK
jgi:hypothetical protein